VASSELECSGLSQANSKCVKHIPGAEDASGKAPNTMLMVSFLKFILCWETNQGK
jgi:hypothetical protein